MMVAVIVYAAIAEPRPPILRASVIALIYCVARLLHRERSYLNWISAAGIVLAIIEPEVVFDIGFQLSFAAVLGVSYLSPAIAQMVVGLRTWFARCVLKRSFADDLTPVRASRDQGVLTLGLHHTWSRLGRYVYAALAVTFAAWLAALPLVAIYFHRVHLWGAPSSFIVFPLVALVMGLGFAKLVIGAASPTLGSAIGAGLTMVDSWLIDLVDGLAFLPGASILLPGPPWWVTLAYYLFLTVLIWRFPRRQPAAPEPAPMPDRTQRSGLRGSRSMCVVTLLLLVVAVTAWQWPKKPGRLTATFLAVGRGSAVVLELPDGRTILCDAGTSSPYDIGRSAVVPFLRHRGIRQIDRVHLSHANLDHFSGLPSIIEEIPTGPVIVNRYFEPRSPAGSPSRHLLELLDRRGRWVQTLDAPPTRWELDGVTFEHLSPPDGLTDEVSTNNTSTVLRVSYAGHSLLLTGDIDEHAQRALIDRGNIRADVLALPHHGAVRSSTGSFIAAVAPSVVIRSSSERTEETHSGLQQIIGTIRGIGSVPELYNTADIGAVEVVIDRDGVRVSPALLRTATPSGPS
jgi:competence protein ComEC